MRLGVWIALKMHGRDLVSVDRVGLRGLKCMACGGQAEVCDINDHEFALCEGCWLAWDIRESGLAGQYDPEKEREKWLAGSYERERTSKRRLRKLARALAEAQETENARTMSHGL